MTWLYVPTACCPSAPAREPSTSELRSHAETLARSVTSRGEPTKPSFWLREWKRGNYPRLRSGATWEPSTLSLGVASWIASLRAIPASQTATPGPCSGPMTSAGCSTASSTSWTPCGLLVSSGRTSQGTPTDSSNVSSPHWKAWVTALRAESSAREASAPAMADPDSSLWPTVTARDHRSPNSQDSQDRRNANSKRGQQLVNFVAWEWSTPTAAIAFGSQLTRGGARSNELLLGGQAALVSSPQDHETTDGPTSSETRLALNPQFVEWLMGWPIGWTDLRPLETELSAWLQLARGLVSKLASAPTSKPQLDLFA